MIPCADAGTLADAVAGERFLYTPEKDTDDACPETRDPSPHRSRSASGPGQQRGWRGRDEHGGKKVRGETVGNDGTEGEESEGDVDQDG